MNLELLPENFIYFILLAFLFLVIFIYRSIKVFKPSDLVAISKPRVIAKDSEGNPLYEDGKPIYDDYDFREGGWAIIPFWKKSFYVLPNYNITTTVSTGRLLTSEELDVKLTINIKYKLDTSNMRAVFKNFSYLSTNKNTTSESVLDKISDGISGLVRGEVPVIVGTMTIRELTSSREIANTKLFANLKELFYSSGLNLLAASIDNIEISNNEYYRKLQKKIEIDVDIETQKKLNELADIKANIEKDEYRRKQDAVKAKHQYELELLQSNNTLSIEKIQLNEMMREHLKEVESFNKAEILVKERAKKSAELEIANISYDIAKINYESNRLQNDTDSSK